MLDWLAFVLFELRPSRPRGQKNRLHLRMVVNNQWTTTYHPPADQGFEGIGLGIGKCEMMPNGQRRAGTA